MTENLPGNIADVVTTGRAAFARSDWQTAYDSLVEADAITPLAAEDLDRAAEAAMWVGDHQACIEFGQRAFNAWEAAGDVKHAASAAMSLCRDHTARQRSAVAAGWWQRAQHLLEDVEECSETGRLTSLNGFIAMFLLKDLDAAEGHFGRALQIARAVGDRDLEAMQLVMIGTVQVRRGDVTSGLRVVDEAMTPAVAGSLGNIVTAQIYCSTISLCQALGDVRRAHEWTEEAVSCSTRPGTSDYPGDCRLHRAEITRLRGDWTEAETELHRVMDDLERWDLTHVGGAWYELGAIELRRGDLAGARQAFARAQEYGNECLPGLVAQLLPVLIEAQIHGDDLDAADASLARLTEFAETFATVVPQAETAIGAARLAAARNDLERAATSARAAISLWRDAGLPYETAQAQHLLADVSNRAGDRAAAIVELDAALSVFEGLGATRDPTAAQMLRARLGDLAPGRRVCRTFMFTDIVDSTRLLAAMGDDRWAAVLRWHDRTIRDLLMQHGGIEVKQRGGGDGFFAAFEQASDAVECAQAIQRQCAAHREEAGFAPDVRIGVHQADALLSGHDFAGIGVHEAARIGATAEAGQIVASATTIAAAGSPAATPPVEVALKGLAAPMLVQTVEWS